jgi:multicomponent Na+:H+ antiporter subunit D
MVVGILGAVAQSDIKRMLSFTLVSHVGYMVFGISLATARGYSGAIFYVAHHITIQTTLFLVLGLIERRGGSTSLLKLGGLARVAPLLALLFFVPAMNLAGIPPMSGFLGKVALSEAALRVGSPMAYTVVAAGMATSLLTLYAVAKAWNLAFWRTPESAHEMARELVELGVPMSSDVVRHRDHVHIGATTFVARDREEARRILDPDAETDQDLYQLTRQGALPRRLSRTMVGATASLVAVTLGFTVAAGPVFDYTARAAHDLLDTRLYISSVLPHGSSTP